MCPKFTETEGARTWQAEFDRRWASGQYKKSSGTWRMGKRVADDTGKLFTREGADCCGCGRSTLAADDRENINRGPRWTGPRGRSMSQRNPRAKSYWF
jgi:hypothetical protein